MATYRDDWRLRGFFQGIGAMVLAGSCAITSGNPALAQSNIVPDATLGAESSVVVPNFIDLPIEVITGGAQRGQNLFHSFEEFNVSEGRGTLFFSPDAAIENILARVTGTNRSEILGLLGTFGNSQPSLFLINPNGIVFGRNALLNVGGSFVASTANSLVFDNGFEFSAKNPQAPPLLTISTPIGLQYGANPGRIVNQSIANGFGLEVQPGRTLALVGGEVDLEGGILFAPDGRIELGSVAENSSVKLTPTLTGYALSYEGVENFQDIRLTQAAFVTSGGDSGGSIQVQGRNVTLTDGSQITANVVGGGKGGGLSVNASESVQAIGSSPNGVLSGLFAQASASSTATGEAGDLTITTKQLLIQDGAQVSAGTFGAGKGGNLIVNASESVQVFSISANGQFPSGLFASTEAEGTGNAGDVRITTGQLLIQDGAQVRASTFGSGEGGNLTINAAESVQAIGTSPDGRFVIALGTQAGQNSTGNAGDLTITTPELLIQGGAQVSTGTFGAGKGGNLIVNASESVQVIGTSADGQFGSGLFAEAVPNSTGDAGELKITTGELLIRDGAQVRAGTFGSGKGGSLTVNASDWVQVIGTSADGRFFSRLGAEATLNSAGNAGDLTITTSQLLIQDGAQVSASTSGSGKGGSLTVNASDLVQVIGRSADGEFGSNLSAQANRNSTGNAGDLTITTEQLLIRDGAQVSVTTFGSGKGGNLTVNASDSVQVMGRSVDGQSASNLSANTSGKGDAGDLMITTSQLLVRDGAQVGAGSFSSGKGGNLTVNASDSVQLLGDGGQFPTGLFAQAEGQGDAGDLKITTEQLLVSGGARVSASARTGDAGDLTITASQLLIRDGAQVSAGTVGSGNGGSLTVNASESVQVIDRSLLTAQTDSSGNAGDLTITTSELLIRDGAEVGASTFGSGKGGNLIINVSDSVQLSSAGGIYVDATAGGTAGSLTVKTGLLSVQDGSRVTVSSSEGQAGDLSIAANSLFLDRGRITAETAKSGAEGGANINLNVSDLWLMRNESLISATAFDTANGGNINIDTQFLVALPPEGPNGSDIIANADRGNGGRINITTQGIFGIEFRPELTPDNDITASSDFGIDGEVAINQPGVDPRQGLTNLPTDVVDATRQIDNRCTPAGDQRSSFIVTGRGGLPPSPTDPLIGEAVIADWVTLDSQEENTNIEVPRANLINSTNTAPKQLVEAQSWVYGSDGQVILVAEAPTATPQSYWQQLPSCRDLQTSAK